MATTAVPSSRSKVVVRESSIADRAAVEALKVRCGLGAERSEAFWEHVWGRNPAARRFGLSKRTGWVLEDGGAVVGSFGCIPYVVRFQGVDRHAATGNALAVDPAYRRQSLKLIARFFRQDGPALLVSTTTGDASRPVFRKLYKMRDVPGDDFPRAMFWVLNPRRFVSAALAGLSRPADLGFVGAAVRTVYCARPGMVRTADPTSGGVRGLAERVASRLLALDSTFRRRGFPRPDAGFETRRFEGADVDESFDDLWTRKTAFDDRLMASRSAECLRWRYGAPGAEGRSWLIACFRSASPAGFVALRESEGRGGLRKLNLIDVFAADDDPTVIRALFGAAYREALERDADVLEVFGLPATVRRVFASCSPYRRRISRPGEGTYLYLTPDPWLAGPLRSPDEWYATANDGDEAF